MNGAASEAAWRRGVRKQSFLDPAAARKRERAPIELRLFSRGVEFAGCYESSSLFLPCYVNIRSPLAEEEGGDGSIVYEYVWLLMCAVSPLTGGFAISNASLLFLKTNIHSPLAGEEGRKRDEMSPSCARMYGFYSYQSLH